MTARRDHLAEMRYALAHNCSLDEARRQLARLRWQATEHARRTISCLPEPRQARQQLITPVKPGFWWDRD